MSSNSRRQQLKEAVWARSILVVSGVYIAVGLLIPPVLNALGFSISTHLIGRTVDALLIAGFVGVAFDYLTRKEWVDLVGESVQDSFAAQEPDHLMSFPLHEGTDLIRTKIRNSDNTIKLLGESHLGVQEAVRMMEPDDYEDTDGTLEISEEFYDDLLEKLDDLEETITFEHIYPVESNGTSLNLTDIDFSDAEAVLDAIDDENPHRREILEDMCDAANNANTSFHCMPVSTVNPHITIFIFDDDELILGLRKDESPFPFVDTHRIIYTTNDHLVTAFVDYFDHEFHPERSISI